MTSSSSSSSLALVATIDTANSESSQSILIAPPAFSDLLTDYNTIKNTDIPPPLWATLDADYREMVGLPAAPQAQALQIESQTVATVDDIDADQPEGHGSAMMSTIMKADGKPLRRVPLIRAVKHFAISDDEDSDSENNAIIAQSTAKSSLKELKAAAARRRLANSNPSPMTIATEEAKARIAAAREARSEQLKAIERWSGAVDRLNKQRDEEVVRIVMDMDEQRRILGGGGEQDIGYVSLEGDLEDDVAGRFVEFE